MVGVIEGFRWALLGGTESAGLLILAFGADRRWLLLVGGRVLLPPHGTHLRGRGVTDAVTWRSASHDLGKQYRIGARAARYRTLRDTLVEGGAGRLLRPRRRRRADEAASGR